MKKYIKPEIEIVEFDVRDRIANGVMYDLGPSQLVTDEKDMEQSAEIFYGIDAGEEGYLVN